MSIFLIIDIAGAAGRISTKRELVRVVVRTVSSVSSSVMVVTISLKYQYPVTECSDSHQSKFNFSIINHSCSYFF